MTACLRDKYRGDGRRKFQRKLCPFLLQFVALSSNLLPHFTHRVCVRAGPLSRDCQSHKNPDNQSLDHELMRARACCLHSLSVLFPLSHPDSRHPLSQQNTGWLLFCCQLLLSDQLNFMYFEKDRGGKRQRCLNESERGAQQSDLRMVTIEREREGKH